MRVALSALLGAALGGVIGYVLFTEHGERLRARYRPHLEGVLDDALQVQGSLAKLGGWSALAGLVSRWRRGGAEPNGEGSSAARA